MPRTRTEYSRRYYIKHKDERLAKSKKWALENTEKVKEKARQWYLKNKLPSFDARKNVLLIKRYGISLDTYNSLVVKQNSCCAICGETRKLYVDHNHITNKVRGLLCRECNVGLGYFKDNKSILLEAVEYLLNR